MKKQLILSAAVLALLTGCGKTDNSQTQYTEWEKVSEEQTEELPLEEAQPKDEFSEGKEQDMTQPETQKEEPLQTDGSEIEVSFEAVSELVFCFMSGAGAWSTELFIHSDGTFEGIYHDTNAGDIGEGFPCGSRYYCNFTGRFTDLEKVDEFTWKMRMDSIEYEQEPDTKEIIDGVRYIYATAYGLDGGEEFYLYLPGAKLADLPEEYRGWVGYYYLENTTDTELPFYGLYNINEGEGFDSYKYEKQSLSESIAMEINFAEERNAELEIKLQEAQVQADMNEISGEIFQTWDDTLNIVWKLLESELDEEAMEKLRVEEREWIACKDAQVEAAGQEYEGGSMQSMTMSLKAAEMTKDRVYELVEYVE